MAWARMACVCRLKSRMKSPFENGTVNEINSGDRKVSDSWARYGHYVASPPDGGCRPL